MCNLHYRRKMRHGDPHKLLTRPHGQGTPHIDGYWMFEIKGRAVLRHVLIAEKAVGHRLPKGAQVHHVDGDRSNDTNTNLVVCPNAAYHQLLHLRQWALDACGHANWLYCGICKTWSPPEQIKQYKPSGNKGHPECLKRHREKRA